MGDVGANHAEGGFDFLSSGKFSTFNRTALAGGDMDLAAVHLDRGEVGGGLDKVLYFAAHGQDTVSAGIESVEKVVLGRTVDEALGLFNGFEGDLEVRLGGAELETDVVGKVVDHLFEGHFVFVGDNNVGPSLAGNGVA